VGAAVGEDLASEGPEVAAAHRVTGARVVIVSIPIGPGPTRVLGHHLRVAIAVVRRRTDLDLEHLPDDEVAEGIATTSTVATVRDAAVPAMTVTVAVAALVVTKGLIGD